MSAMSINWFEIPVTDLDRAYYGTDTRAFGLLAGALASLDAARPRRTRRSAPMRTRRRTRTTCSAWT